MDHVYKLNDLLDENVYHPILLLSVQEGEAGVLESIFGLLQKKKHGAEKLEKLDDRLRPIKLASFMFGTVLASMAIRRFSRGEMINFATTAVFAHDLLRVSERCYVKSYAVAMLRLNFPDMLTTVGNTIGQIASFIGLPARQDDYFKKLFEQLDVDVLTEKCLCKSLWAALVKNNIIETKKRR